MAILDVYNHTKHSYIKNVISVGSSFVHENSAMVYYKGVDWEQVLSESYEIVTRDSSFAKILKEEEFSKSSVLDTVKRFYHSVFGTNIFEEQIRYLQDTRPRKNANVQTGEHSFAKSGTVDFHLTGAVAELVTEYKTQLNLRVITQDVTLLKKINKYSYYDHHVVGNSSGDNEIWAKLLHIDLPNHKLIYLLWQNSGTRLVSIDLNKLEEFNSIILSANEEKHSQANLEGLLQKLGIIEDMVGINSATVDDDVLRTIARKIQATKSNSNTAELLQIVKKEEPTRTYEDIEKMMMDEKFDIMKETLRGYKESQSERVKLVFGQKQSQTIR